MEALTDINVPSKLPFGCSDSRILNLKRMHVARTLACSHAHKHKYTLSVRLIFSISLHFDSFCFLLSRLAKVKVKGKALRPKAPEHSVVLWSPRHQHQNHPAMDWLFGKGSSIDQLIVCLHTIIHPCFVCRPDLKYNWYGNKFFSLSCMTLSAKGSWVSGVIGDPLNLFPNTFCKRYISSHKLGIWCSSKEPVCQELVEHNVCGLYRFSTRSSK